MKIILVSTGNFQEYIIDNIKNLQAYGNTDIDVITEKHFFNLLDGLNVGLIDTEGLNNYNFNICSQLDKSFRNGFWHLCSLRFFYIYSYIEKYNIKNCIHLENDVISYVNFNKIEHLFNKKRIYVTFDSETRVIPGIMFIPDLETFTPIIQNYNVNLNDMQNLACFNDNIIEYLPIISEINEKTIYNKNFNHFNCIFDAAAMGQYLGGIDKRNQDGDTRGFVNETCIIKYNNYSFYWLQEENNNYAPYVIINNKLVKILNLHIHSKDLYKFQTKNPLEDKYIKKIL